jgi:hypothetical protein
MIFAKVVSQKNSVVLSEGERQTFLPETAAEPESKDLRGLKLNAHDTETLGCQETASCL